MATAENDVKHQPSRMRLAVELSIPSDVRYIERVISIVVQQCETLEFPPRQIALNVQVALAEALSNAILRGNGERPESQVHLRANADQERLVLEIEDEGDGFDLRECIEDPTTPENLQREDGRGLFLMTRLMDRVERFNLGGNVVRLTLRRDD